MGSTQFSVREAAERAGVSRQTMFRHIKDGKISATVGHDGQKQIELSELLRVFRDLKEPETVTATAPATPSDRPKLSRTSHETPRDSSLIQVEFARLQAQLEIKTAQLEMANERISELKTREHNAEEEKNRLLSLIERQSLLLAAPAPMAPAKPATRRTTVKKAAPATKTAARSTPVKSKPAAKPATKTTARTTTTKKKAAPAPVKKTAPKPAPKKATSSARTTKAAATKTTARTTKPAATKRRAR